VCSSDLAVKAAGAPLRMTLENRGPERLLQIVGACRGHIVFHKRLQLKERETPFEIGAGVDGLLRVTALEVKDGQLMPLTERLFFRPAARRLDIAVEANTTKGLHLNVKGFDERKQPLAFWALACVADDRFRGDALEPSLSSHFLLLGDAPADADLAELPIVNLDAVPNKTDLELILGVYGWRRVGALPANAVMNAQAPAQRINVAEQAKAREPAENAVSFFYRIEPSAFELRQKIEQQFQAAQIALVKAAQSEQRDLIQQRKEIADRLASARFERDELTKRPREQIMAGLGVFALVLLGVGALWMIFGLVKLMRRQAAGLSFGAACGCLAACLALFIFRPEERPNGGNLQPSAKAPAPGVKEFQIRDDAPIGRLKDAPQASGKVALADRAREEKIVALEKRDNPNPALAEMVEQQNWTRRVGANVPPGDQYAKLDQSRQGMLAYLNNADQVQRGSPPNSLSSMGPNVALVPEPYGPVPQGGGKGGFGGGFGGGGAFGGNAKGFTPMAADADSTKPFAKPGAAMAAPPPGALDSTKNAKEASPKPGAGKMAKAGMLRSLQSDAAKLGPDARGVMPPLVVKAKKLLEDTPNAQSQRVDLNILSRQFAERRSQDLADPATLLWNPALFVPATGASVSVDVPALPARYRVLFLGHTEDGCLGAYDGVLYSK